MPIALGLSFTLALNENGDICGFGKNNTGQLGTHTPGEEAQLGPVILKAGRDFSGSQPVMLAAQTAQAACVTADGCVWTWGMAYIEGKTVAVGCAETWAPRRLRMLEFGRSPAIMVACGRGFTVVLTAAGLVWNCGEGGQGELGHGDRLSKSALTLVDPAHFDNKKITMIAAGYYHTLALSSEDNNLWTWGCGQIASFPPGSVCVCVCVCVCVSSWIRRARLVPECCYNRMMCKTEYTYGSLTHTHTHQHI